MEVVWLGHSCFKISGKNITIITDPFDSKKIGYKPVKSSVNVITISHNHPGHNEKSIILASSADKAPVILDTPGEYEIKGSVFWGISSYHDDAKGQERGGNTIFVFEVDGLRICHLGDLGCDLSDTQLEQIGDIDILLIPVGGQSTIDAEDASKIISEIEPKIVIPMHYSHEKLNSLVAKNLDSLDKFSQEMGVKPERKSKLKVSKKDLPEEIEVVVLEC